jgi:hypothetical protein
VGGAPAAASGTAARAPETAAEATRISEALSGKPSPPPEPQRGRRPGEPPQQHPRRPAAALAPAGTPDASVPPRPAPTAPKAEATSIAPAPTGAPPTNDRRPASANAAEAPVVDDLDVDDLDVDDLDVDEGGGADSAEVKAIDATLARFSAVHDQIAEEEEARRKRFTWLLGKRKAEPELGKDMPFDFVEGRDAQASRREWKKEQRKHRTARIATVLAIVVVLGLLVAVGLSMLH